MVIMSALLHSERTKSRLSAFLLISDVGMISEQEKAACFQIYANAWALMNQKGQGAIQKELLRPSLQEMKLSRMLKDFGKILPLLPVIMNI